jgi:hypothetical protein
MDSSPPALQVVFDFSKHTASGDTPATKSNRDKVRQELDCRRES